MYWVYVMQSQQVRYGKRGRKLPGYYYVGMTTDPRRRAFEHNGLHPSGKPGNTRGAKWTAKWRPLLMKAIFGPYESRSESLKAEYALKHSKRGEARTKWSADDSPWCRGEGVADPRVEQINEDLARAFAAALPSTS